MSVPKDQTPLYKESAEPAWPWPYMMFFHYPRDADDWPDTWDDDVKIEVASYNDFARHCRTYRLVAVLVDGEPKIRFEHVGTGRL